uniref:SS18 subunit of BAF chromatin remodeling complex n=1 Tax=Sus scrofa TaxID=9823 RepID=A0A8D0ZAN0_PIG
MSVAFAAPRQRGKGEITPAAIQKMLDENNHLIQCIMDYQNKGKTSECSHFRTFSSFLPKKSYPISSHLPFSPPSPIPPDNHGFTFVCGHLFIANAAYKWIHTVIFFDRLLSLSSMFLSFTHVEAYSSISFFFIAK